MGYESYLAQLLQPLGVYDLGAGAVNRGELGAYGNGLDQGLEQLEETAREMSLATAEGIGLERVEELLPYRPVSTTVQQRRQALAALLRIGGDSFTLPTVNDTLSGCGINAAAAEGDRPGYVEVSFPDVAGIPENFTEIRAIIEEILPCHLEITYVFWYNTWAGLIQRLDTWGDAEATGKTWYELATWKD